MSRVRTKSAQSATERDVNQRQARAGRVTRAESQTAGRPLLEYIGPSGGATKWCSLYYGGETRAGD